MGKEELRSIIAIFTFTTVMPLAVRNGGQCAFCAFRASEWLIPTIRRPIRQQNGTRQYSFQVNRIKSLEKVSNSSAWRSTSPDYLPSLRIVHRNPGIFCREVHQLVDNPHDSRQSATPQESLGLSPDALSFFDYHQKMRPKGSIGLSRGRIQPTVYLEDFY